MRLPTCTLVLILVLAACDSFTPDPGDQVAQMWIENTAVILNPDDALQLTAMGRETDNSAALALEELAPGGVRWWSDDREVVRISDDGTAEAVGPGATTVWVEGGGRLDSATVAVRDPGEEPRHRWKAVAVGENHVCALTEAGVAYCWGSDYYGRLGRGGFDDWRRWTAHHLPQRVAGEARFVELVAGARQTCGRTAGNSIYCWGDATTGGVGRGSGTPHAVSSPQRIAGDPQIVQLSSGYTHVAGLTDDGRVLSFGNNFSGQVGDGTFGIENFRFSPTAAETEMRFASVGAGNDHTCALTGGGNVWCWGRNDVPIILSEEPMHPEVFPVPIVQGEVRFERITGGEKNTCALDPEGVLYCWGGNEFRHAGASDAEPFLYEPRRVEGAPRFERIRAANNYACGITAEAEAFCWGRNGLGELGIEETLEDRCLEIDQIPCTSVPMRVQGGHRWAELDLMGNHPNHPTTCGVTTDGALYCWGSNVDGKLGIGRPDVERTAVPQRVLDPL